MNQENESRWMTRRQLLYTVAAATGTAFAPAGPLFADSTSNRSQEDEAFLDLSLIHI